MSYRSLKKFVMYNWKTVEQSDFIDNWHLDCICDHLEAVTNGDIKRLLINMPPRHCKSMIVSVFWPMWVWLRRPDFRWLFSTYAHSLSLRDSIKARSLYYSAPYQGLLEAYQPEMALRDDQNTRVRWENIFGGYRLATSIDGGLTGEGGDGIVCDDPHDVMRGESDKKREDTVRWWTESMSTRLNDQKNGFYVIIAQRVHESDLSGYILENAGDDWTHVCLPARYENYDRIRSPIGWSDPRSVEGELLWKERFGEDEVSNLEKSMSAYAVAAQLQQRPAPREGGMFPVDNLIKVDRPPFDIVKSVRYWDKGGNDEGGDFTVGVKMHLLSNDSIYISDVVRGRWDADVREKHMRQTAERDGEGVIVGIEVEGGSSGKDSARASVKNLMGYPVHLDRPTGSKEVRADPLAAQVQGNNVYVQKDAPWFKEYEDELRMFPKGAHDDQVDASSGAFKFLVGGYSGGSWGRRPQDL